MEVIGVVGSIVNIVDVIAECIGLLQSLGLRWRTADLTMTALISQLGVFKAALDQINQWAISKSDAGSQYHQTIMDLDFTLNCCRDIIMFVNDRVSRLEWDGGKTLTNRGKIRAVLDDKSVKQCIDHLSVQSIALNLLLTALNRQTLLEQKELLEREESREIFDRVRDNSSSLIVLRDSASCSTNWTSSNTERSSLLSKVFDFDSEIQASGVYQAHVRSLIRRVIGRNPRPSISHSALTPKVLSRGIHQDTKASNFPNFSRRFQDVESKPLPSIPAGPLAQVQSIFGDGAWIPVNGEHGSGSTTILEQMGLSGEQTRMYDDAERETWREIIVSDVVTAFKGLMRHYPVTNEMEWCIQTVREAHEGLFSFLMSSSLETALWQLWHKGGLREGRRSHGEIDMDEYYCNSIDRIISPEYLPSDRDIAHGMWKLHGEHPVVSFRNGKYNLYHLERHVRQKRPETDHYTPTALFVVDISAIRNIENDVERMLGTLKDRLHDWEVLRLKSPPMANPILILNKADLLEEQLGPDFLEAKEQILASVALLRDGTSEFPYVIFGSAIEDGSMAPALKEIIAHLLGGLLAEVSGSHHTINHNLLPIPGEISLYKQAWEGDRVAEEVGKSGEENRMTKKFGESGEEINVISRISAEPDVIHVTDSILVEWEYV